MKYLKRFNENFNYDDNLKDGIKDIKDIFQPLNDETYIDFSEDSISIGDNGHISIEVVADDENNGFDPNEKEVIFNVLEHFKKWSNNVGYKLVGRDVSDCSYVEVLDAESICPECGSFDIIKGGWDSEWSCRDCDYFGGEEDFNNSFSNIFTFDELFDFLNNGILAFNLVMVII